MKLKSALCEKKRPARLPKPVSLSWKPVSASGRPLEAYGLALRHWHQCASVR